MNSETAAIFVQEGTKLITAVARAIVTRPPKPKTTNTLSTSSTEPATMALSESKASIQPPVSSRIALPNRDQTTRELKRRLARELYKAELDLANGLMIAGRPCDCLSEKHTLQLDACAEELISQDPDNSVYQEIRQWIVNNQHKVTPEATMSGKYKKEYPHMALQFKEYRKRTLGTSEILNPEITPEKHEITLEEVQEAAAQQAREEVKRRWVSQEKKLKTSPS